MFCKDGEYHPFAACLMFKASKDRNVVWANMNALMDRGREIERAIPKGNECMAALTRHNEQTQQRASASADWIPYDGSGMPVDRGVIIDAKLRSGQIVIGRRADHFAWGLIFTSTDIIAYRIAKPVTQASADDGTPETDKVTEHFFRNGTPDPWFWKALGDHARKLERDRNRLQRASAELRSFEYAKAALAAGDIATYKQLAEAAERENIDLRKKIIALEGPRPCNQ